MSLSTPHWGAIPPPSTHITSNSYAMHNPAYTAVQTPRMSFTQAQPSNPPYPANVLPPPPGLSAPPPAKKKKIEWPNSVREYVRRAFEPQYPETGVTKEEIEQKLKETITAATDLNTLNTTDWDNMPLPHVMIQNARIEAAQQWQQYSLNAFAGNNGNYVQAFPPAPAKKRKSGEVTDVPLSPWHTNKSAFEDRITYPTPGQSRAHPLMEEAPLKTSKFQKNMEKRQRRFDGGYVSAYRSPTPEAGNGPVVGRCEVLEKRYLRLTAAPNPELVRPLHILKQSLDLLKKKWRKENNYSYICDQLKSVRQDLTVQHIKDKFTVEVYELHARIALEKGDLGEYNQCQTQLRALYAKNLGGNPVEFKAYRILYFIHTANRTSLNDVIADLTIAEKEEPAVKHALAVRSALALGNYHRFFRLYLDVPNMGAYLMDMFIVRERLAALSNISRAYKPSVPLRFITEELGFESDQDAATFICEFNGEALLEQKENDILFLSGKAGAAFETAKKAAFSKVDIKGQI